MSLVPASADPELPAHLTAAQLRGDVPGPPVPRAVLRVRLAHHPPGRPDRMGDRQTRGAGHASAGGGVPHRHEMGSRAQQIRHPAGNLAARFTARSLASASAPCSAWRSPSSSRRTSCRRRWCVFLKNVIELLAAIPSVVYGLWGIFVVIPAIRPAATGSTSISTGFRFSARAWPAPACCRRRWCWPSWCCRPITAISRDALAAVPPKLREAAFGLGATRWETILAVILPTASRGIFGSIILAFGRALGETMALAMLVGNSSQINWSLFAPANTLAALLANKFPEASSVEIEALMYAALVLLAITLLVNIVGTWIIQRTGRGFEGRSIMASVSVTTPTLPEIDLASLEKTPAPPADAVQRGHDLAGRPADVAGDGAAVLGAGDADLARRATAQPGAVHRVASRGRHGGRRHRQCASRHLRDGRHRQPHQRAGRHPGRRSSWPSLGRTRGRPRWCASPPRC